MAANFSRRLQELREVARLEYEGRRSGGQVRWFRPDGWDGDLFNFVGMHAPFSRDDANQQYLDAVKDPANPGTTGDVVAATTQIDFLACLERAFRVRHTLRRPRAMAHMMGRMAGHASEHGPLVQCGLEYVRAVLKQARVQ